MASIVVAGDTSGTVTLAAPATAGTTTLTLPTTSGTVLTSASSVASSQLPAGSVLQVVNATYSTQVTNNTATYADTGLTASITPTSSSNKILVIVNQSSVGKNTGLLSNALVIKLVRNSTDIIFFGGAIGYTETNIYNLGFSPSTSYLDSPATTSSVTYKTQFANNVNNAGVRVQTDGYTSTITLMEIKA
jgi:hypothetical protein